MKYFALSHDASVGIRSHGNLMKGLLLCMAMVLFQFNQLQAQGSLEAEQAPNSIQFSSESNLVASPRTSEMVGPMRVSSSWDARDVVESLPNPDLPSNITCTNLRVVLLLDESGSIFERNGVQQVREATLALAEAFQNSPAYLTVIEFGSKAEVIDLSGNSVNASFLANLHDYLYNDYNGQSYDPNLDGLSLDCPIGYTNWEDALEETILEDPNLVLFMTDGEPSAYNSENDCGYEFGTDVLSFEAGLAAAIPVANTLKENGVHIFAIGVGDNVAEDNLQLISDSDNFADNGDIFTDDYSLGSFEDLRDDLTAGLNAICGTELSLSKTVDIDQVCGEETLTFTLTVTNTGGNNNFTAVDVVITDVFPDAYSDISILGAPVAGASIESNTLTYEVGDLAANDSVEIIITASISLTAPLETYVNTASANAVNANIVQAQASVEKTSIISSTIDITACESYAVVSTDFMFTPDPNQDTLYNTPGLYTRILTGLNEAGCDEEVTLQILINSVPDPITVTVDEPVCGSYQWTVNDVVVDTYFPEDLNEQITYLEVFEDDCDQLYILDVEIQEQFVVVVPDPIAICPGDDIALPGGGSIDNVVIGENGDVQIGENFIELEGIGQGPCSAVWNVHFILGDDCQNACIGVLDDCGECRSGEDDPEFNSTCLDCEGTPNGEAHPGTGCTVSNTAGTYNNSCQCIPTPVCSLSIDEYDVSETCDPETGLFTITATLSYTNAPEEGQLEINGNNYNITGSPQSVSFTQAQGQVSINASFLGLEDCTDLVETQVFLEACEQDCDEVFGGTAFLDDCGDCVGGNTGETACEEDCEGVAGGSALPGAACDAGEGFINGTLNDECMCVGTPVSDCELEDGSFANNGEDCTNDEGQEGEYVNCVCLSCPNLGANNGDICTDEDGAQGVLVDCECISGQTGITPCPDHRLFYANHVGSNPSIIYSVEINEDDEAHLTQQLELDYITHMAYNEDEELLYFTNQSSTFVDIYDASTFDFVDRLEYSPAIGGSLTAAVHNPADGFLYVGRNNQVRKVDLSDGTHTQVANNVPVSGGDLVLKGGNLYLVTNAQGGKIFLIDGGGATEQGSLSSGQVNGAALSADDQILISGSGSDALNQIDLAGNVVESFPTFLDGAPFTLAFGDLASGCSSGDQTSTPCYGARVLNFSQGLQTNGNPVAADRSDTSVVVGPPSLDNSAGSFFSLGVGGFIEIAFDGVVQDLPGNDILVVETSFSGNDCGSGDDEFADIALTQDGDDWVEYGAICRNEEIDIAAVGLDFVVAIRITNSATTTTLDGYDVDGVVALQGCQPNESGTPEEGDCYGVDALVYNPVGSIPANRMDANQALGAPERDDSINFVALGFGGSIIIGFDGTAPAIEGEDDLEVVETTFGTQTCDSYEERADVYVSQQVVSNASEIDSTMFVYVGQSCTNGALFDVFGETGFTFFTMVKIVDATPEEAQLPGRDGYDVDGVVAIHNCAEDPTPEGPIFASTTLENVIETYPNPTDGQSNVIFTTAKTTRTMLQVYDASGREVATLFNQTADAGMEYRLNFNGSSMPNGMYIYRLTTEDEVIVRKFMIAR